MASGSGGAAFQGGPSEPVSVDVIGLRQFQRELKKLGPEFPKKLKEQNYLIASGITAKAKAKARSLGYKARSAEAMSARAEQRYASVRLDGSKRGKFPFALGDEFGTKKRTQGARIPVNSRGPRKYKGGFGPWRGNQWTAWGSSGVGYFLHPTIRAEREQIMRDYERMIERVARDAFNS